MDERDTVAAMWFYLFDLFFFPMSGRGLRLSTGRAGRAGLRRGCAGLNERKEKKKIERHMKEVVCMPKV